jgi:hypothetical protein
MAHFDLEQADDGFRQSVVLRVAYTADRRLNPRSGKALCLLDQHILSSPDALLFVKW